MNIEICNSLSGYIEILYKLNQELIKLCGTNVSYKYEYSHTKILNIIQDIPRVIPYSIDIKAKKLTYNNCDGLLEYNSKIKYMKKEYEKILISNYETLNKIRKIRNKYEHKMHDIKRRSSSSGKYIFFEFIFKIKNETIKIEAIELINLIKQVNTLFSKFVKDIKEFIIDEEKLTHPYYNRITRFDFEEFNKLYDSELFWIIGKLMLDF